MVGMVMDGDGWMVMETVGSDGYGGMHLHLRCKNYRGTPQIFIKVGRLEK